MEVHHMSFVFRIFKNNTQWLCPRKYSGTEPTYFSYVSEKYGLVAAVLHSQSHTECRLRASAQTTTQHSVLSFSHCSYTLVEASNAL